MVLEEGSVAMQLIANVLKKEAGCFWFHHIFEAYLPNTTTYPVRKVSQHDLRRIDPRRGMCDATSSTCPGQSPRYSHCRTREKNLPTRITTLSTS
jgi:hypothetical protein